MSVLPEIGSSRGDVSIDVDALRALRSSTQELDRLLSTIRVQQMSCSDVENRGSSRISNPARFRALEPLDEAQNEELADLERQASEVSREIEKIRRTIDNLPRF